jgi:hypothetical protein
MISRINRPVTKSLSRTPAVMTKKAAAAKRVGNAISRFEPVARKKTSDARLQQHRRDTLTSLWEVRGSLRKGDKPGALDAARRLAGHLGVAVGSATRTAKSVLTLIGRQVIRPDFTFRTGHDLHDFVKCAYRAPAGKPNDPDPTSLSKYI